MFELQAVSKRYHANHALWPTSFTVGSFETTVLIGESGSGKSTLLRIFMGLIPPDEGRVLFDGEPLTEENAMIQRRRMGYVIQDGGLFPHLNAEDNVLLLARYLKMDEAQLKNRLDELLMLTKFPGRCLKQFPLQLSGGQRQRVSLMRALMLNPEVLLLDEPMGALDPMIRSDLQSDLKAIFRELRKTVILVTHDLGEASFLGDRIILMKEGRVVQDGDFKTLSQEPADAFVSAFINAQRPPHFVNYV
ncbi:MAG: ATP-binding cassette domain-containing protein [Deltaproteobacteria bacterium]|nr:ATP-binding cassette domain-containing protein [Deltaproteobacteria bacterium]MBI3296278.1 ATP-binding cassette domain-containing protein [Deltaproteobacteria bacterium]